MALQATFRCCSPLFSSSNFTNIGRLIFQLHFSTPSFTKLSRGDIVLCQGRGDDVLHLKAHPHIVISSKKALEVTKRVALVPLSTAAARFQYEVIIPSNNQTGIDKTSKVVANQIRTGFLEEGFVKIGSAADYLPTINQALMTRLGPIKAFKKGAIERGDVLEIDFGKFIRSGVTVSNDIENQFPQIALLTPPNHKDKRVNEFELLVKREGDFSAQNELLVHCYMINTFAQGFMDKAGKISEEDMDKVTKILFKTLDLEE